MRVRSRFAIAAILAAATIGEGVFALPYVIARSGWLLALTYFIALIAVVSLAHTIYYRTLAHVGERERLLGLARQYFGETGFWTGFLAIVIGLLLGFVAYLQLGARFLMILDPTLAASAALFIFWVFLACLIWGSDGRVTGIEGLGITLMSCAILFIFFSGHAAQAFREMPLVSPGNFFLPFGAVLFSLAGWTAVEQIYELTHGALLTHSDRRSHTALFLTFAAGTSFAALLYWLFSLGVVSSVPQVATDTISGIAAWPLWKGDILAVIGILSVGVVSIPIARALRGAMEKDLGWNSFAVRAAIVILPIAAILAGLRNFLAVVSIAGGVFLSIQYLLIIAVGRRTLVLTAREKILLDAVSIIFICAAVYEIVRFVV